MVQLSYAVPVAFLVLAGGLVGAHAQTPATPECRQVESEAGGQRSISTLCRGADGVWRPRQAQRSPDALSPDFRGRVSYSGTHRGEATIPGPPVRRLTARDIIRSATGGRTRQYSGSYSLEVQFDGDRVTGRYSGTGGVNSGSFTGTRSGDRCSIRDDSGKSAMEAECSATRFAGTAKSARGVSPSFSIIIETRATRVVDAAREREQAAQAINSAPAGGRAAPATAAPGIFTLTGKHLLPFDRQSATQLDLIVECLAVAKNVWVHSDVTVEMNRKERLKRPPPNKPNVLDAWTRHAEAGSRAAQADVNALADRIPTNLPGATLNAISAYISAREMALIDDYKLVRPVETTCSQEGLISRATLAATYAPSDLREAYLRDFPGRPWPGDEDEDDDDEW